MQHATNPPTITGQPISHRHRLSALADRYANGTLRKVAPARGDVEAGYNTSQRAWSKTFRVYEPNVKTDRIQAIQKTATDNQLAVITGGDA